MFSVVGTVGGYNFTIHSFEKITVLCFCYLVHGRGVIAKYNQRQTSNIEYFKCKQSYQPEYAVYIKTDRRLAQKIKINPPTASNLDFARTETKYCTYTVKVIKLSVYACTLQYSRSDKSKVINI
uniref:Uncharacterized protein n=1 Tax=Glossina austeni TaxID=7395 RepID=A0A1A9V2F7_GLOAU